MITWICLKYQKIAQVQQELEVKILIQITALSIELILVIKAWLKNF